MINWLHTIFDKSVKFDEPTSVVGSVYKLEKQLVDHNGQRDLEIVGKTDFYEYIQSHKDSVDINVLLSRYQQGDISALDRVKGQYLDISEAPKSLAEMYSFVNNASEFFNKLPLEVRKEYSFNPASFIADIGSDRWNELMQPKQDDDFVVESVAKPRVDSVVKPAAGPVDSPVSSSGTSVTVNSKEESNA